VALGGCSDPACVNGIIQSTTAGFLGDILTIDSELEPRARKISSSGTYRTSGRRPQSLAEGPLASALGTALASTMSDALAAAIGSDLDVKLFDSIGPLNDAIAKPWCL